MIRTLASSPKHAAITGCSVLAVTCVIPLIADGFAIPQPWYAIAFISFLAGLVAGYWLINRADKGMTSSPWTTRAQAGMSLGSGVWITQIWLGAWWGGEQILRYVGLTLLVVAGGVWVLSVLLRAMSEPQES